MPHDVGPLIIDLEGPRLQAEERELLQHPLVGGLIFFSRHYESREQLKALVDEIRASVKAKPFLIMVDQEGGRVQRFRDGFTRIPQAALYGKCYDRDPEQGLAFAETAGWLMATELLAEGIDLSLAPILDLDQGLSSVIGDRAFHQKPAAAIRLASAYIEGMKRAGMAATGKHFPGHGGVAPDSHLELPLDPRSYEAIAAQDLLPFMHFIKAKIPALMTAHIAFPAIDALPVSFSKQWLTTILRHRLGFEGVIISDDLDMKGAASVGNYAERMILARQAGCDLILLCNNRPAVLEVLNTVSPEGALLKRTIFDSLRGRFQVPTVKREACLQWQQQHDFLLKTAEGL